MNRKDISKGIEEVGLDILLSLVFELSTTEDPTKRQIIITKHNSKYATAITNHLLESGFVHRDWVGVDERLLSSQMKYYQDAYLMNTKLRSEGYESEYIAKAISTNKDIITFNNQLRKEKDNV